jgi:DNA-binding XRE family transcriptional regulator
MRSPFCSSVQEGPGARFMSREVVRVELNPDLLVWARASSGFNIDEVARAVDVTPDVIAAWEIGEQRPTIRQLERLAHKVKRPLAAFFLPKPPTEPPPRDFRLLPAAEAGCFTPATLLAFRQARNIQQEAIELADALGDTIELRRVQGSLRDDPEELADRARRLLGISITDQIRWRDAFNALAQWRAALERTGLLTLQFSMPREDARGFSLDSERLPVIVVTTKRVVAQQFRRPAAIVATGAFQALHMACLGGFWPLGSSRPAETPFRGNLEPSCLIAP